MKKLLFVLAFSFIGQQAFAQMYIVTYSAVDWSHTDANCNTSMYNRLLTTVDPTGSVTYICMFENSISTSSSNLITLNQELNTIISQGYKLIETNSPSGATLTSNTKLSVGTVWYFAIP